MLARFNNLTQRVITGLLGIAIMIGLIIWSEWGYFGIFLFITVFAQQEFYKLVKLDDQIPLKTYGTICGALLYMTTFFIQKGILPSDSLFLLVPIMFISFLVKLYKKEEKKPFTNIAFTFMGIIYIALPFSLLNVIAYSFGHYNWMLVTGILVLLWASDTGAYFAGVNFGRTKLFERVSPKKSWEGFIGGACLSMIVAYCLSFCITEILPWQWLCMSAIIVITGTYGDLIESLFKRSISIKDSANSLPGHGGFLDRFDGLLLAAPFIVAFLKVVKYFS
ncbi:MAG: phosphatidate cytidylyltransferase [Cytophagales bacterium]|nr:phosphatidate cytidylyltransferase [Cytophagales bacterium]